MTPDAVSEPPAGITAIVVACNEAHLLTACLGALAFCDEIIVVDLESADGSGDVARQWATRVISRPRTPIVELVRQDVVGEARNDWILFVDPDEVIPAPLAAAIRAGLASNPEAACVRLPTTVYFRGKPLRHSVWGQPGQGKRLLFHRRRALVSSQVHGGIAPLPGLPVVSIQPADGAQVHHHWARSYAELIGKHRRYLRYEGAARHARGERFSWWAMMSQTWGATKANLIQYGGARGGVTGIFLSLFHAWYTCMGWLALRRYERESGANGA